VRARACVLALAALVALVGCGGTEASGEADRGRGLLSNLPSCDRVSLGERAGASADVTGLVLPEGATVTSVVEQNGLTTVEATVRMTPLDVRAFYQNDAAVDVLRAEDEVFESEVLVRAEQRRMYLRATALCADGTALTAVVGPDSEDAGLPEIEGGG
jgi:hypothetical protein